MSFTLGYVLLIGVGQTEYSNWSLPVTVKDAQAIRDILINPELCGYLKDHTLLLHDDTATRDNILQGLTWLKDCAEANGDATIIVYYSGHGWLNHSTQYYYLLPHDTKPFNVSDTALSANDFTNALRQITAKRLLVILDCCHAEGMAIAKEGKSVAKLPPDFVSTSIPKDLASSFKQGTGRAIFTSCRGNQKSWIRSDHQMSIYTYHLLEALQGAGNKRGDTDVRISNLMNYLGKAVPESARKFYQAEQVPFLDAAAEDFSVAILKGGKGLPVGGWESTHDEARQIIVQTVERIEKSGVVIGIKTDETVNDLRVEQSAREVAGKLIGAELKKHRQ